MEGHQIACLIHARGNCPRSLAVEVRKQQRREQCMAPALLFFDHRVRDPDGKITKQA